MWTYRVRCTRVAGLVLLAGLSAACAAVDAEPQVQPKQPAAQREGFGSAGEQAKLQACYATAKLENPALSVHTTALYFAREGKLVFVDVTLPETPKLARCLSDAVLTSYVFDAPAARAPGTIAVGSLPIDLGPPLAAPAPRPSLAEIRARDRRVTLEALRQGALRASDPIVRDTLNPPPPWPTREMQAELDACHRDALRSQPGLVLHRDVIYLARGSKVLLADVNIPEAPELRRCVLERIQTWSSPFSNSSSSSSEGAVMSGFFLDLGGPEEFPDQPPGTLTAELARRRALVARALELGLIANNDPLLQRFEDPRPAPNRESQADPKPDAR